MFVLYGFCAFWLFVFLHNAICDYLHERHMRKWIAEREAYNEWAKVHQTKSPYEAMDECGHLAAKSKKDIDELFNKLPGL